MDFTSICYFDTLYTVYIHLFNFVGSSELQEILINSSLFSKSNVSSNFINFFRRSQHIKYLYSQNASQYFCLGVLFSTGRTHGISRRRFIRRCLSPIRRDGIDPEVDNLDQ